MYLVIEEGSRVFRPIMGGVDMASAMANAKRLCRERDKPIRIRDADADRVVYTMRPESIVRRKACDCPAQCWGPKREQHAIKCRPARPACRWRRRERGLCECVAYHYPHRSGSGRCLEGPHGAERYEQHLRTARYRAA